MLTKSLPISLYKYRFICFPAEYNCLTFDNLIFEHEDNLVNQTACATLTFDKHLITSRIVLKTSRTVKVTRN